MAKKKRAKNHSKHELDIKKSQLSEKDFEEADKILRAMLKVPPPKKSKK